MKIPLTINPGDAEVKIMSNVSRRFNILLILSVALSVVLSSLAVSVFLMVRIKESTVERNQVHLMGISRTISSYIESAVNVNYQLSVSSDIRKTILEADPDWAKRSELYDSLYDTSSPPAADAGYPPLAELKIHFSFADLFHVEDREGNQTARSHGPLGQRSERWWYQRIAVNQDYRPFISGSYFSLTGGIPVATIFHPVIEKGEFLGIMATDVNFDRLQELVQGALEDTYVIVTDMDGVIIAH
ncbi:MAG: cache domain-containing protein, partial [Spirochaetales bacterium]|nr:cache domain-containing protein [Spirochaetales bacterium]